MPQDQDNVTLAEIEIIEKELNAIEEQITTLKCRRIELEEYRDSLFASLSTSKEDSDNDNGAQINSKDYNREDFSWSEDLKRLAKVHWNITQWREKQLQVMNAALDRRDVFVLMPTGGGKSLCYQLPALITSGITLVVSPLLSLIRDQAFHLEEASIGVGMLTSNTSKEENKRIMDAMLATKTSSSGSGGSKRQPKAELEPPSELRLVYVTPEKISKSKRFMNHLEKVYAAGRLARIVVDECHCCSQLGHDFRPDYKKLGILRVLFPKTPIMALTATASSPVIESVLNTLNLAPIGKSTNATLMFDSPLFRANLVYKVLSRPNTNEETFRFLVNYIQTKHHRSNGIIYCLSKKDTHVFAEGIYKASQGQITTSAYHSDILDDEKNYIHECWRDGRTQLVCATIAFGLGINHPNVRFVIHVCMAKSLEGYYQESGRAGRDGLPADCVLLYRDQDASRLSTLCVTEPEGLTNVYSMIKYAQDVRTCRHQQFDNHFSKHSSSKKQIPCGMCDNCLLAGKDVVTEDLKTEVRALCLLVNKLQEVNERVTLNKLVEAWRGVGSLRVIAKVVRDEYETEVVPKRPNKDDYDRIINYLILNGYLREDFHFTAYSTLAYIINGPRSNPFLSKRPLSSLPPVNIEFGRDPSRNAETLNGRTSSSSASSRSRKLGSGLDRNGSDVVLEDDIQRILDEEDGDKDEDDAPLMKRAKKTKATTKPSITDRYERGPKNDAARYHKTIITVSDDDAYDFQ